MTWNKFTILNTHSDSVLNCTVSFQRLFQTLSFRIVNLFNFISTYGDSVFASTTNLNFFHKERKDEARVCYKEALRWFLSSNLDFFLTGVWFKLHLLRKKYTQHSGFQTVAHLRDCNEQLGNCNWQWIRYWGGSWTFYKVNRYFQLIIQIYGC